MTKKNQEVHAERSEAAEFAAQAAEAPKSLPAEWIDFLLHNKKWWLTPILLALLAVAVLVVIGSSGAAPFLYTIF
jgi:hypothetical protein